jgi:hypothetical protein
MCRGALKILSTYCRIQSHYPAPGRDKPFESGKRERWFPMTACDARAFWARGANTGKSKFDDAGTRHRET